MSVKKILEDDWSEYDDRKKRSGSDARNFACTESWEVDYLKHKIKKHHPFLEDRKIADAIQSCCQSVGAPHPRPKFVACVAKKLGIPEI